MRQMPWQHRWKFETSLSENAVAGCTVIKTSIAELCAADQYVSPDTRFAGGGRASATYP